MARTIVVALLLLAVPLTGLLAGAQASEGTTDGMDWASQDLASIYPGASLGGYCTFNFLFTDDAGSAYIGTAGHCTDGPGERVHLGVTGGEIGTVVVDSDTSSEMADAADFSLIRLDDDRIDEANPTVPTWGGPTGVLTAASAYPGMPVGFHGYGLVFEFLEPTRSRAGFLVSMSPTQYDSDMPAVNGDSGAPIVGLDDGLAIGVVSHYGIFDVPPTTDEGPTIAFVLDQLAEAGWHVDLAHET